MKEIKNIKLYEQVADMIKTQIMSGKYKKGEMIPSEKMLIEETGVSRITVREAIKLLTEMGIVKTLKGKGSVLLLDREDFLLQPELKEKYGQYKKDFLLSTETRIIMEPEFCKYATVLASDEDIKKIEISLEEDEKNRNIIDGQQEFHKSIVKSLKNIVLEEIFEKVIALEKNDYPMVLVPPYKQASIAEKIDEQHKNILEAIKRRDGEFAYFYMKEHLLYLKSTYEKYFENYEEERN